MSFTDQKLHQATEEECKAPWSGHRDGSHFRCYLCGHKFRVGDWWRWVCSGDRCWVDPNNYKKWGLSNLMVCKACDGTNDEVLDKWVIAHIELYTRFWWSINQD